MDEFVIEKNVPIPDIDVYKKRGRFAGLLEKMQVGDSVVFPDAKTKQSFCNYAKLKNVLVVSRKIDSAAGSYNPLMPSSRKQPYRVWKVAPKDLVRLAKHPKLKKRLEEKYKTSEIKRNFYDESLNNIPF